MIDNELIKNEMREYKTYQEVTMKINEDIKEYKKNPFLYRLKLNKILKESGLQQKINRVSFDNGTSCVLWKYLVNFFEKNSTIKHNDLKITIEHGEIHSMVNEKITINPRITFHFSNDHQYVGHIGITPKGKGINFSRVLVEGKMKGCGLGTLMMNIVLDILRSIEEELEIESTPLYLECVGSVGWGVNKQDTPIGIQKKFFMKFGFKQYGLDYRNNQVIGIQMKMVG